MLGTRILITPFRRRHRSDLLNLAWYSHWTHEHLDWYTFSRWLDRDDALVFLAWAGDNLLAYLGLSPEHDGSSWLRLMGLRDGFMPDRIIRELWHYAEAACIERGIKRVMVLMVSDWLPGYLRDSGFIYWDDIISFEYLGNYDPHQPRTCTMIRLAEMAHLPAIAQVDRLAFQRSYRLSQSDLSQALRLAATATIAVCEGEIVGYQVSTRDSEGGHLARLAVIPSKQRQQIGSALLQRQLHDFGRSGVTKISVNTQLSNVPSQRLYQRYGFVRTGLDLEIWIKALPRPISN